MAQQANEEAEAEAVTMLLNYTPGRTDKKKPAASNWGAEAAAGEEVQQPKGSVTILMPLLPASIN